ncbi:MAG: hypothetical protein AB7U20_20015 [Planctomycetaceae bacterium]
MGSLRCGLAVFLVAGGISGCQCCRLTDHYADAVDCVATHETALDALYHPGLDLTRIGRADWCQCGINRALCPCACERRKPLPHIVDTTAAAFAGACPHSVNGPENRAVEQDVREDLELPKAPEQEQIGPDPYLPPPSTDQQSSAPAIEPPAAQTNRVP